MKQLLILSGKGGTGKTTVAAAFISLSKAKAFADCDVDAPNLHLVLKRDDEPQKSDFFGMEKAEINTDLCIKCGICLQNCRFDAILKGNDCYKVDPLACEGCGVCEAICPCGAVSLFPDIAGKLILFAGDSVFSTAQLKMGSGNSGKLVSQVKKQMKDAAENIDFSIIAGSPGIGCPVIASLSGVDLVLIVAEPSLSGISDMERIIITARIFGVQAAVCINKYNLCPENSERIVAFCRDNGLAFVGNIPFDKEAVKAVNSGKSIAQVDCLSGQAVREVYANTMSLLQSCRAGGGI